MRIAPYLTRQGITKVFPELGLLNKLSLLWSQKFFKKCELKFPTNLHVGRVYTSDIHAQHGRLNESNFFERPRVWRG